MISPVCQLSPPLARAGDRLGGSRQPRPHAHRDDSASGGILEHGTVELLAQTGASTRVLEKRQRHDGVELRFAGGRDRIDFPSACGRDVWLHRDHGEIGHDRRDLLLGHSKVVR